MELSLHAEKVEVVEQMELFLDQFCHGNMSLALRYGYRRPRSVTKPNRGKFYFKVNRTKRSQILLAFNFENF